MQILADNFVSILGMLLGGGGLLMWFLEHKKYSEVVLGLKAENESKEIENDFKIIGIYKGTLDDLGKRYEDKFKDFEQTYERKIKLLEEEISLKERIITNLKRENRDLKRTIRQLESGNKS